MTNKNFLKLRMLMIILCRNVSLQKSPKLTQTIWNKKMTGSKQKRLSFTKSSKKSFEKLKKMLSWCNKKKKSAKSEPLKNSRDVMNLVSKMTKSFRNTVTKPSEKKTKQKWGTNRSSKKTYKNSCSPWKFKRTLRGSRGLRQRDESGSILSSISSRWRDHASSI